MKNKRLMLLFAVLTLSVLLFGGFANNVDSSDKVAFFSNIVVPNDMTVDGSAVAIFGNVAIDGAVQQDVVAIFGNVTVNGIVDGDIVSVLGTTRVNDKAVVRGDVVGVGGGVDRAPGAVIRGDIEDVSTPFGGGHNGIPFMVYSCIIIALLVFGVSCVVILLIPDRIKIMTDESFAQIGRRFGIGFLMNLLYLPIIIVLCVTVIGIIIVPFFMTAFFIVSFVGTTAVSVAIGKRLSSSMEKNKASVYICLLIGTVVQFGLLLIPVLGWAVLYVISLIAMGVAVDTRIGSAILRK